MIDYLAQEVRFMDFANLMRKRHYTVDDLVELFHGKIEDNRAFFTRVMARNQIDAQIVIPYRSVLDFFFKEQKSETIKKQGLR